MRNFSERRHHLDLDRVVVVGHSAGGHLALIAHARERIPSDSEIFMNNPLSLRGVVALDACGLDLLEYASREQGRLGAVILDLLGSADLDDAQRRMDLGASPTQLLPHGGKQRLFTGTVGAFEADVRKYSRRAASLGDDIETSILVGADHFDQVDPCGPAFPIILTTIFDLIDAEVPEAARRPDEALGYRWQILPRGRFR